MDDLTPPPDDHRDPADDIPPTDTPEPATAASAPEAPHAGADEIVAALDPALLGGDRVEPAPETPVVPTASFVVETPSYNGPLDLLLTLIRDEQVDIYDIPIARIAKQFLARLKELALDEAADYLEMAARLVRIKAQMLLPRTESEEEWEDPRAELVRRLLEYQQMREVVDVLEKLGETRRNRFGRTYLPTSTLPPVQAPLALSLSELLSAVDRVLRMAKEPTVHTVVARALDVAGAITTVRGVLSLRQHGRWTDVVPPNAEPWQVLSALLALLELAKLGELKISQSQPFANLEFQRDAASEAA